MKLTAWAYAHLPVPARSVAATAHGLYLRAWRYGRDAERLVEEALEREQWSAAQWEAWRQERLAFVLERAATSVPYYKRMWAERRGRGDRATTQDLANWPVLEKDILRAQPRAFVADDRSPAWMFHEHTSGTTGASLDLWRSHDVVRAWYALSEARWRRWYGVSRRDRWAIFGGRALMPAAQTVPPFWVWNAALHQLYCSSYHISAATAVAYARELRSRRVSYLLGYTSALHALAGEMISQGLTVPGLKVVVTNAEPVYPHQREAIGKAFGCPVRESYGLAETVTAASECERGSLHLWPEAGVLEVLQGESAAHAGESGELVGTSLLNADMPLIRYRIGDRGALSANGTPCGCGRTLPRLSSIEGRSDDVLYTRDGRAIGRLDPVFKAGLRMLEAQIIQERLDTIRVRYVPSEGFSPSDGAAVVERLRERMGDVRVVLEPVPAIPRNDNGKFRAVVCRLPAAERPASGDG